MACRVRFQKLHISSSLLMSASPYITKIKKPASALLPIRIFLMDFQILCIMIQSGLSCTRNIQFGYWLCMAIELDNLLVSEEQWIHSGGKKQNGGQVDDGGGQNGHNRSDGNGLLWICQITRSVRTRHDP